MTSSVAPNLLSSLLNINIADPTAQLLTAVEYKLWWNFSHFCCRNTDVLLEIQHQNRSHADTHMANNISASGKIWCVKCGRFFLLYKLQTWQIRMGLGWQTSSAIIINYLKFPGYTSQVQIGLESVHVHDIGILRVANIMSSNRQTLEIFVSEWWYIYRHSCVRLRKC